MTRISLIVIMASCVSAGCVKNPPESISSRSTQISTKSSPRPVLQRFDLGPVLTSDGPLRHEFTIENPTNDTMRIVRATALTPYCSSIENYPEKIPPFGKVVIPVIFKPGHQSGAKSVSFFIETDKPSHDDHMLELIADLHPGWEVIPSEVNLRSLPLGLGGKLEFTVICRKRGNNGLQFPDSIEAREPLKLTEYPVNSEVEQTEDFAESMRRVVVDIPAGSRVGLSRGALLFRWNEGGQREHVFEWDVTPAVRSAPSILIFNWSFANRQVRPNWATT